MEQRRFPRWPVAVLVSLGLVGAFVAVASAIEGSNEGYPFAKARVACANGAVHAVSTASDGQVVCVKAGD